MSKEKLIDLDRDQLELLHTILQRHIPDKTVWAYGSRATWKATETSDLDLVVFNCDPMRIYDLKEAFEESDLLVSVDVMDWESIPDDFKENIRRKYVVVQDKAKRLEGWREVRLGDVAEVIGGGTPKTSEAEYWNGKIPWLTPRDLSDHSKRYISKGERNISELGLSKSSAKLLPIGTVLLSTRAPVGYLAIAKCDVSTNQGFRSLIPNEKTDSSFLFYLLKQNVPYLQSQSEGTTFGELSGSTLRSLSFLFPPLPEQKAIAEVLSSLDDKIDLLHRQNKTLEDMAQALFRKWFASPESKQWDTGTLHDEFAVTMGQSPPGTSYNEEKQGSPLFQGNADFGFRFPKNRVYTTEPKRFAEKYDTLISVHAPVGEQNMARERCCIGRGVASFSYKEDKNFYTYTYYKMKSLMNRIKQYDSEGTVFGSISKSDFEKLEIILPPYDLVQSFQDKAQAVDEKITVNQSQIQKLENLRDILLPKLMSGKIRVDLITTDNQSSIL